MDETSRAAAIESLAYITDSACVAVIVELSARTQFARMQWTLGRFATRIEALLYYVLVRSTHFLLCASIQIGFI